MHSALLFLASVHCVSIYLSLLSDDFEREFDSIEFSAGFRRPRRRARPAPPPPVHRGGHSVARWSGSSAFVSLLSLTPLTLA